MAGAISVKILADARDASSELKGFSKEMDTAGSKWEKLGGTMKSMALPAAAALAGIGAIAKGAIDAAATYETSLMGMSAIYGDWADEMEAAGKRAASSIGLSAADYTKLATDLGGVLQSQGLSQEQMASVADPLIAAADTLGDVFGVDLEHALSAIESGIKGKGQALKDLGVDVSSEAIAAKLASGALGDLSGMSEQTSKALAIAALITDQAAESQAALGDNSGTLAEQQDRVTAQFENLKVSLGEKLLPVVEKLMGWVEKAATWMSENSETVAALGTAIAIVAGAIVVMNAALAIQNMLMAANPVMLIVLAIAALIALIVLVVQNWDKIREVAGIVADWIAEKWNQFTTWLGELFTGIGEWISGVWQAISDKATSVADWISGVWRGFVDWITGVWDGVKNAVGDAWQGIKDGAKAAIDWIRDRWEDLTGFIGGIGDTIRDGFGSAIEWVEDKLQWLIDGFKQVGDFVSGLFGSREISASVTAPAFSGVTAGIFDTLAIPRITSGTPRNGETINVNITFTGLVTDPISVGRQIESVLRQYDKSKVWLV